MFLRAVVGGLPPTACPRPFFLSFRSAPRAAPAYPVETGRFLRLPAGCGHRRSSRGMVCHIGFSPVQKAGEAGRRTEWRGGGGEGRRPCGAACYTGMHKEPRRSPAPPNSQIVENRDLEGLKPSAFTQVGITPRCCRRRRAMGWRWSGARTGSCCAPGLERCGAAPGSGVMRDAAWRWPGADDLAWRKEKPGLRRVLRCLARGRWRGRAFHGGACRERTLRPWPSFSLPPRPRVPCPSACSRGPRRFRCSRGRRRPA